MAKKKAKKKTAARSAQSKQLQLGFGSGWAVVANLDAVAILIRLPNFNVDVRQDVRLFAGVEAVVHCFLNRGEQSLALVIETEQMAILGEEFGDGNMALRGGHRFGRSALGQDTWPSRRAR